MHRVKCSVRSLLSGLCHSVGKLIFWQIVWVPEVEASCQAPPAGLCKYGLVTPLL